MPAIIASPSSNAPSADSPPTRVPPKLQTPYAKLQTLFPELRQPALFLHDAKRNQWLQAGHVTDNRSPYNLFTFPTIEADALTYLWLRSPDGHARLAELEAYSPPPTCWTKSPGRAALPRGRNHSPPVGDDVRRL
ncbi:hypothetical protein LBMAG56_27330 [Verrucomicrobiota bacterium]|nr:hypothetical protein LBMAG56_27330 [Verrucomicrobiota bacterium]